MSQFDVSFDSALAETLTTNNKNLWFSTGDTNDLLDQAYDMSFLVNPDGVIGVHVADDEKLVANGRADTRGERCF